MSDLRPHYRLLEVAAEGSDRVISASLATMLRDLVPSAVDQLAGVLGSTEEEVALVRRGLHRALDFAAHGALASDFLVSVLDIEWERLGGHRDDPAPWREAAPFI